MSGKLVDVGGIPWNCTGFVTHGDGGIEHSTGLTQNWVSRRNACMQTFSCCVSGRPRREPGPGEYFENAVVLLVRIAPRNSIRFLQRVSNFILEQVEGRGGASEQ